jgi:hypothetical protein
MKAVSVSLSVLFAVAAFASTAAAEHDDVIVVKVHENCSLQDYVKIKDDFNATWAKEHGYQAEVSVPLQATELTRLGMPGETPSPTRSPLRRSCRRASTSAARISAVAGSTSTRKGPSRLAAAEGTSRRRRPPAARACLKTRSGRAIDPSSRRFGALTGASSREHTQVEQ